MTFDVETGTLHWRTDICEYSAASLIEPGRAENIGRVFGVERAHSSRQRIPGLPVRDRVEGPIRPVDMGYR